SDDPAAPRPGRVFRNDPPGCAGNRDKAACRTSSLANPRRLARNTTCCRHSESHAWRGFISKWEGMPQGDLAAIGTFGRKSAQRAGGRAESLLPAVVLWRTYRLCVTEDASRYGCYGSAKIFARLV